MEYGLVIGFIDTTRNYNYSTITDLHTLQITAANTKSFPARSVFNSRFLVTDVNSGDSSASCAQVLFVTAVCAAFLSIPSYQLSTPELD
jgi:hypothetical protein